MQPELTSFTRAIRVGLNNFGAFRSPIRSYTLAKPADAAHSPDISQRFSQPFSQSLRLSRQQGSRTTLLTTPFATQRTSTPPLFSSSLRTARPITPFQISVSVQGGSRYVIRQSFPRIKLHVFRGALMSLMRSQARNCFAFSRTGDRGGFFQMAQPFSE